MKLHKSKDINAALHSKEALAEDPSLKRIYENTEYIVAYRESLKTSYYVSIAASISGVIALIYGLILFNFNVMFISGSILTPAIVAFLKTRSEIKKC